MKFMALLRSKIVGKTTAPVKLQPHTDQSDFKVSEAIREAMHIINNTCPDGMNKINAVGALTHALRCARASLKQKRGL